jgi:ABC-2 type transport system permease protein
MKEFLRASLSFAWLDFKALRYYPMNGVLQIVQSFVGVSIWFFVSLFLQDFAGPKVESYGGNYVAYVVVGVLFFQNVSAMMNLPHQSLSAAYWDRRLEVYHARSSGLWAFLTGRLIWAFVYQTLILLAILGVAIVVSGGNLGSVAHPLSGALFYIVFVLTCTGIGLIGASNFFTLEVKQGREPITWTVDVLARIFSGVYYPITVLPAVLRGVSFLLPHTYALFGIRQVMINGAGFGDANTLRAFLILSGFCVGSLAAGIYLLDRAIRRAEKAGGVGIAL